MKASREWLTVAAIVAGGLLVPATASATCQNDPTYEWPQCLPPTTTSTTVAPTTSSTTIAPTTGGPDWRVQLVGASVLLALGIALVLAVRYRQAPDGGGR